jgi:hypothetical protein
MVSQPIRVEPALNKPLKYPLEECVIRLQILSSKGVANDKPHRCHTNTFIFELGRAFSDWT